MGGCWVGIYCVNAYQIEISDYMTQKYDWLKPVADFIAPVCLSVINLILPLLTNLIISLERWDYQSTVINNQIWRNFLAKEFNIILFFLITVDMIVPIEVIKGSSRYSSFKGNEFPCAEVQISVEFIKIIATDFVVNLVKHPIKYILYWLFAECRDMCSNKIDKNLKRGGSSSKKAELDISEVRSLFIIYFFKVRGWYTVYIDCFMDDTPFLSSLCLGHTYNFVHYVPLYSYCREILLPSVFRRWSLIQ